MSILIKDCFVLPMDGAQKYDGKAYFRGSVGISGREIIFASDSSADIEKFRQTYNKDLREIDGRGRLVMPGMINTHGHVSMTFMRGVADDMPLMEWLNEHMWPFEAKMTADDIRMGAELGVAEMLLGGTTTFVDMYWKEIEVAKAVEKSGIRAVLSPTFTDALFEEFMLDFEALIVKYANGMHPRITLMIAPHSVYMCSRENLLAAKTMAEKHGLAINIHVSETQDEQKMMRERIDKTPIEYLDELGMLTPTTLVVHTVHVNDSDIATMARHGVSVAHNPHSNMKLSSGIPPVGKMIDAGLNVSIGTDGASSNNDLDMWEEMRTATFLAKVATMNPLVLPAYDTLKMATVNGAKAIGMGGRLGQIRAGMIADLVILDVEKPHLYPQFDMVANLVYCAKCSDVDSVIVDGEFVVEAGRLKNIDALKVCHDLQKRAIQISNTK